MTENNTKLFLKRAFFFLFLLSLFSEVTTAPRKDSGGKTSTDKSINNTALSTSSNTEPDKNALVDINQADKRELMSLPGIGVRLATRIIEFRHARHFQRKEDIMFVRGIGEKKFKQIENLIIVIRKPKQ